MIPVFRSALFAGLFYGLTIPLALVAAGAAALSQEATIAIARAWGRLFLWSAEVLLGIRLEIRGQVPQQGAIVAMKHTSAFEALLVLALFDRPATIMKAELLRIPVWGFVARRQGSIGIAREKGGAAMRAMIRQARAAAEAGRPVIIFPEGTRVPHGAAPPLRPGLAALAGALGLPVVPVAHDAGRLWPRGLVKKPGTVTMAFGPPIPPDLPRPELEAAVHAAINRNPRAAPEPVTRPAGASRLPFWVALLPLLLFLLLWRALWDGHRDRLVDTLRPLLPDGTRLESGGFPYRLEVRLAPIDSAVRDVALEARLRADALVVNQVPWKPEVVVVNASAPEAEVALRGLEGAVLRLRAPAGQASLRRAGDRILRLSTRWEKAEIATGLVAAPMRAERFELHLRETPADAAPAPGAARSPAQAAVFARWIGLSIAGGAPLELRLETELTSARPIRSLAGWLADGTVEVSRLVVSDAHGEVARAEARIVPDGAGGLRVAGTVTTVCPASVAAALAAAPPVLEMRARRPLVLPLSGRLPRGLAVAPPEPGRPIPVRGQEPPCPRLR